MMEARSLFYSVGGRDLVRDVSLDLRPGEVTAVLGPNGAGKSSLLKLFSGERPPTSGEIRLDGRPLAARDTAELARRRAVLPQESVVAFPFSAGEIVLLGRLPHLRGAESRRDFDIAAEAMRLTGVSHLARRLFPTLSGGERQRVHLARALAQIWECPGAARFLLLDEPTSNLDLAHQHETLAVARDFAARGVGVLVILHDLNLAAEYADRIVLLSGGAVQAEGTPGKVLTETNVRTVFGLNVAVISHPKSGRPHVIPVPRAVPGQTGVNGSRRGATVFPFRNV
jgi:iron complex transport system ATP-binding protein